MLPNSLTLGVVFDGHTVRNQATRNIGLGTPQRLQSRFARTDLAGHCDNSGKYSVSADEVAALTNSLARQPRCFVAIARPMKRE
jgi:hypothetical protein